MIRTALFLAITIFCFLSCGNENHISSKSNSKSSSLTCNEIPKTFTSYNEAIQQVRSKRYKIQESVNTNKSSWIRGAEFYSCDGSVGYFILGTDKRDYIHERLPLSVWQSFREADSFGEFYNTHIRGRYRMYLQ